MEFGFLADRNDYVTAKEIAVHFGISEKTMKNDVSEISDLCNDAGAELISKKHYGYKIEVFDSDQFTKMKNEIFLYFNSTGVNNKLLTDDLLLAILQTIITSDGYLTTEDMAEKFYCTRSQIIKRKKTINEILDSYGLKIKGAYEDGAMVKGREFDIRLLMLDSIENFHYLNTTFLIEEMYDRFFRLESDEERLGIRKIFLDTLRLYRYRLRDDSVNKFAMYLCLLKKRYNNGYRLYFNEQEKETIKSFKIYPAIKEMFQKISAYASYPSDDDEVLGMTLILVTHLDGSFDTGFYPERYTIRSRRFASTLFKEIDHTYGFDLNNVKGALDKIVDIFTPIFVQDEFGMASHKYAYDLKVKNNMNYFSGELVHFSVKVFEEQTGSHLSESNAVLVSLTFSDILTSIDYRFNGLNIALVSLLSLNNAELLRRILVARFGRYINFIDTYELYELRPYPLSAFDIVICSFPIDQEISAYRYDWPVFSFENIPSDKDLNRFYNEIIIDRLKIDQVINDNKLPSVEYIDDVDMVDADLFTQTLILRYAKDNTSIEKLKDHVFDIWQNQKNIMFFFFPRKYTRKSFVEIYRFKRKTAVKLDIQYAIAMSIDVKNEICARILSDFCGLSSLNYNKLKTYIENKDPNIIELSVKEALKVLPISLY